MVIDEKVTFARRSTHQRRSLLVDCPVCHRWSSVPTLNVQAICREAGCCLDCMRNDYFLLKIRIEAIQGAMASIAKRGQKLPENERPALREVYARKAQQLVQAREQLAALEANHEKHRRLAKELA